ncbi:MAG: ATP-binding cassette domain-containing protein [Syntrophorhabdaceae bacterium]|nr:ATP-binding cassette domain-containing protein [Syntrophorhabdaceae bacterium]
MENHYLLRLEHAAKTFVLHGLGGKKIMGFRDINFTVRRGESVGLAGPSGSGKSSIIKSIYRTYLLSHGHIWYDSKYYDGIVDISKIPERAVHLIRTNEIGYISQFLRVIPRVAAVEIVAEPLIRNGVPEVEAKKVSSDLLKRLLLPENLHDAYPSTFSGGEQQKINIAKTIVWRPRLLLLDEPTASLDTHSVSIVMGLLKELKEGGTAMVGIFHDAQIMNDFADTVYNIDRGFYVEQ